MVPDVLPNSKNRLSLSAESCSNHLVPLIDWYLSGIFSSSSRDDGRGGLSLLLSLCNDLLREFSLGKATNASSSALERVSRVINAGSRFGSSTIRFLAAAKSLSALADPKCGK